MGNENAIITSVRFEVEPVFHISIRVDREGGGSQGWSSPRLYHESLEEDSTGLFLTRLFAVTGKTDLSEMSGVAVRVKIKADDTIQAMGYIIKDLWVD